MTSKITLLTAILAVSDSTAYVTLTQERDLKVGKGDAFYVNSMRSLYEAVPLDYYDLPFPRPNHIVQDPSENLGQLLMGDKLQSSPYIFRVQINKSCDLVGGEKKGNVKLTVKDQNQFKVLIDRKYRVHMMYEAMDLLSQPTNALDGEYRKGFPIGGVIEKKNGEKQYYINNRVDFTLLYNTPSGKDAKDKMVYVVGFNAEASSNRVKCTGNSGPMLLGNSTSKSPRHVHFSYSVTWKKSDKEWSGRFTEYVNSLPDARLNIAENIKQSLLIMLLLTVVVAWIMMRTLHIDFNRYNNPDNEEEMREEVGWKLVHTDVFRPPKHPNQLAAFIGTGVQLFGMAVAAVFFSLIGFVSPGAHGNILAMMIFTYAILAIANGFVCGTLQMTFNVKQWKTPIASAIFYPGVVFILWGITECFLAARKATSAVGFSVLFMLIIQWWGISLPLIVLGASIAYKRSPITPPIPYRSIAKQIPPQIWLFSTPSIILLPGLVTSVAVGFELSLITKAIWQGRLYLLFGYIAIISIFVIIIIAEVTIVVIYHTLIYEDYRWWWKSIVCNSGAAFYFFIWCIYFMSTSLHFGTALSYWLFFCFAIIVSIAIVIVGGTIGFFSAWAFVTKIYNAIKIE